MTNSTDPTSAEPVAWLWTGAGHVQAFVLKPPPSMLADPRCQPLYVTPPVPVSPTDEQLLALATEHGAGTMLLPMQRAAAISRGREALARFVAAGGLVGIGVPVSPEPSELHVLMALNAWRSALVGLCQGHSDTFSTPELAAENVRRRLRAALAAVAMTEAMPHMVPVFETAMEAAHSQTATAWHECINALGEWAGVRMLPAPSTAAAGHSPGALGQITPSASLPPAQAQEGKK